MDVAVVLIANAAAAVFVAVVLVVLVVVLLLYSSLKGPQKSQLGGFWGSWGGQVVKSKPSLRDSLLFTTYAKGRA